MSDESPKIDFFADNGIIEIRYFDTPKDEFYRSWKLPKSVADELIKWWLKVIKPQKTSFPINVRSGPCEFTMHTEKFIDIREIDSLGRFKMTGWSLPSRVVEELLIWQKKNERRSCGTRNFIECPKVTRP
ncbi:MAG: hypothetical protein KKD29_04320 [Candidatus Omnitrophica bacterium]|nr:hypothetical protein [Candidatus Omnitrophota bacterium]